MATEETIHPCPFSKGYGIPRSQAWLLLTVFCLYRLIISSLFVVLFFTRIGPSLLGSYDSQLYAYASLSYLALALISVITTYLRKPDYTIQTQIFMFTDIVLVPLVMHACGGITSGIGILLAVTTAAGGLLIGGRCAMLFAAMASLSILTEQIYASQTDAFENTAYTYAGMLGASFFTIALLSYVLARRTEQTESMLSQREQTIFRLEELNKYIIRQLNSGIIISNQNRAVSLMNDAALRLLNRHVAPKSLDEISSELSASFENWRINPDRDIAKLKTGANMDIHLRFIPLKTRDETYSMIILEDVAIYNQRLQQGKLASLGQLTASIAHEIRNPLSAISHAGQLLSERDEISDRDKRLTDIIRKHTDRVNKIIEDILQLSRRTPSIRKKIKLGEWLPAYLQNFISENRIDENFFLVELNDEHSAFIDPDHLKQILDNLCHNALKYGRRENGLIILKISYLQNAPCIEVIDNGPGIYPENRDRLFEPFFTTSATGTGLGLYISRELAQLNQAELSYHVSSGGGSCFRLSLSDADKKVIEI